MSDTNSKGDAEGQQQAGSARSTDPNAQISRKLRQLYQSVQDEAIPDRFLDLLEQLDHAEKAARQDDKQ